MDRKDDMDLESLKNMLSDVPDTDEFDLDSIIAEVSGQAPAKAAEPKITAEPEKPVEPQPAPAAETKAEGPKTAPRNKKDKTAKKVAETAAAAEHESVEEVREARIAAREQKMEERERRTAQKIAERQARREAKLAEKEAAEKAAEQQEIVEEAAAEEASRKASISRKQARAARIAADQAEEEEDIKLVDPETAMHAARRRSGILSFRSLLVLILAAAAAYLSFAPSFEALPLPVVLDILQNPTIGIGALAALQILALLIGIDVFGNGFSSLLHGRPARGRSCRSRRWHRCCTVPLCWYFRIRAASPYRTRRFPSFCFTPKCVRHAAAVWHRRVPIVPSARQSSRWRFTATTTARLTRAMPSSARCMMQARS